MSEEVTEVKEITEVTVKEEQPETVAEINAEVIVAKAEAAVQKAEESAELLAQAANIQVAEIAIEAEAKMAEHEQKVDEIGEEQKWHRVEIAEIYNQLEMMRSELSELRQSIQSQPLDSPQTVEIVEQVNAGEDVQVEQQESPPQEVPIKAKRKIRAI